MQSNAYKKYQRRKKVKGWISTIIMLAVFFVVIYVIFVPTGLIEDLTDAEYSTQYVGCNVVTFVDHYESSPEDAIDYVNKQRTNNGESEIDFDERVYDLAVARAKDMYDNKYLDHTNPETGECPDNMKQDFGLKSNEYVAENAFGWADHPEGKCVKIEIKPMTEAVDSWMDSKGHRNNLLYSNHIAGAVGCYKNMCAFLGLNKDGFGKGCYTAAEGIAYWANH